MDAGQLPGAPCRPLIRSRRSKEAEFSESSNSASSRRRLQHFLIVWLWLVLGLGSYAADTNAVLAAWLDAQTNLQTWEADFVQTRNFKTLTQPLSTPGHLWFAKPNQFRWQLGSPPRTIAVRERDEMWVVYPMLKHAERYPLGGEASGQWREALELLESGFPRDRAELESRFRVVSIMQTNGSWLLAMEPRGNFARQMLKEIRVGLATSDFSLTSDELVFADGSRMKSEFTNAVLNPVLDREVFAWKPEPGYKITQPMKK